MKICKVEKCNNKFKCRKASPKRYCTSVCASSIRELEYPDWVGDRPLARKELFTKEEWNKLNAYRANSYYHRNIDAQRKQHKKWQTKNAKLQKLYAKRAVERKRYGKAITPLPEIKNAGATRS